MPNTYDAIVVGSGICGGWAAKELCEKGLKVLLLERGRDVPHVSAYKYATAFPYGIPNRGLPTLEMIAGGNTAGEVKEFFVNRGEHPYREINDGYQWTRGYQVGGRSLTWGRQCYRIGKNIVGEYVVGDIPLTELKTTLMHPGEWGFEYTAFGETLPHHDNRITLSKTEKDAWGLPLVEIHIRARENEEKMRKDMADSSVEMLETLGFKDVKLKKREKGRPTIGATHEMGLARMGNDPKTSVLNGHNQVWDAKNVFVTDGSCMVSSACQNPSLTYMAITARAANFAVEELKKGNL